LTFNGLFDKLSSVSEQKMKIQRNDPCSCGSGLKYKKCCLLKIDKDIEQENIEYQKWFAEDEALGQKHLRESIYSNEENQPV